MTRRGNLQLVFHGAILLLVGMFVGIPGFPSSKFSMLDPARLFWRQAHLIPVLTGTWMIASGAALPSLKLTDRREWLLAWSLIIAGYAFLVSLLPWAYALFVLNIDIRISSRYLLVAYMLPLLVTGVGSLIGDYLIIIGARDALRDKRVPRLP
jgi:uncharacterized membrane protein